MLQGYGIMQEKLLKIIGEAIQEDIQDFGEVIKRFCIFIYPKIASLVKNYKTWLLLFIILLNLIFVIGISKILSAQKEILAEMKKANKVQEYLIDYLEKSEKERWGIQIK